MKIGEIFKGTNGGYALSASERDGFLLPIGSSSVSSVSMCKSFSLSEGILLFSYTKPQEDLNRRVWFPTIRTFPKICAISFM